MLNNLIIRAWCTVSARFHQDKGITAIEYAIIGVAMSSALYYIFNDGNFLQTLSNAWKKMGSNITNSGNILS
ncbi:pilus assembly protein Flp/PilA [Serratia fonticola]|jgi:pilus assembly protein Flp/PilA|uniref:Pilus assembly protein Flp/PilA n=1 Tax=Serratia fonticola TaxID=47917 RepID=A0A559T410_SERFO|nr:Flp family type IVb pilin [Serratia fonticola]TQI78165.1 pilus assembly protein Flp/PilA [Serratia fonticola]TQI94837.1 pilus assembly protein Flp/PilA [Serratia fonticola]TVZ69335.1 pilus assembly protein Flp/PilA [Serratia fonticola]